MLQVNTAVGHRINSAENSGLKLRGKLSFRPAYRLRKTDEFSSVFALRRTQRSRHFVIHHGLLRLDTAEGARLGIVVAKRFLKRAHDRNLIKRLAREAFRHARNELKSLDIILRLNMRPGELDRQALRAEIDQLLGRMRRPGGSPAQSEQAR